MIAKLLALLRAHWPLALAALVGAAVTWFLKPNPAPAVHETAQEHATATTEQKVEQTVHEGEWSVKTWEYAPKSPVVAGATRVSPPLASSVAPAEPTTGLYRYTEETHSPSVTETHAQGETQQTEDRKLEVTITPAPPKGWALQLGIEDALHGRTLRLAARRRLLGPFWAEVSAEPAQRSLGVGLALEF